MPFTRRRRALVCFYCGSRSQHQFGGVKQFKCDNCEAENYLDENGQITEPPVQSTSHATSTIRFARSPDRIPSPPPTNEYNQIFCEICLKNQYLLKETLASYLPADDDPQYDQFLDSYDDYRKQLEQRYPQICGRCAPKAREKIKKSAYLAKTDHLRRMMDRTRQAGHLQTGRGFLIHLMIRIVGIAYTGSTLLQALWHVLAAMAVQTIRVYGIAAGEVPPQRWTSEGRWSSLFSCIQQAYQYRTVSLQSLSTCTEWIPVLLCITLVTLWWNPQLSETYSRGTGLLKRIKEYYVLQIILLVTRAVAFHSLQHSRSILEGEALKGGHLFMAFLILSGIIVSLRIIEIDHGSAVSFQLSDDAVLPNVPITATTHEKSPLSRRDQVSRQPFPLDLFSTTSVNPRTTPRATDQLWTPNRSDAEDTDVMDWTPTNKPTTLNFNSPAYSAAALKSSLLPDPSPFHGTLPPAPIAPAHRLRNPPANATVAFRKASEMQKSQFSMNLRNVTPSAHTTPARRQGVSGDRDAFASENEWMESEDDKEPSKPYRNNRGAMEMAAPRFWPQQDRETQTGLEDIFEDGFTIRDTPKVVTQRLTKSRQDRNNSNHARLARGVTEASSGERWGGFGERQGDVVDEIVDDIVPEPDGWSGLLAFSLVPAACLGIAIAVVKGGYI